MAFFLKMGWFFRERWKFYAIAILLIVADYSLGLLPARIVGNAVNGLTQGGMTRPLLEERVLLLIGIAVAAYAVIVTWVNTLFRNSIYLEKLLRSRLLEHLTKMSPSFFHRFTRGELMAQATNDIRAVNMAAGFGVMTFTHMVVGGLLVMSMMLSISWKLMLASMVPLPFLALAIKMLGSMMRARFFAAQQAFGRLNDQALESISGLRVIRAYGQEDHDVEAFRRVAEDARIKNVRVSVVHALFQPVVSLLVGASFTVSSAYGAWLILRGELALGDLIAFHMYLGMLIWPMIAFGEFMNVMQRGSASAERIMTTLSQPPELVEADDPVTDAEPGAIEFRGLSFRYPGAGTDSLRDITLRLERGRTLGVVGRTGSGKSTLLKQLLRLYPVEPERLFIGGVPIERLSLDLLKSWIGYVPQEHMLLSGTIRDNIRLGRIDAPEEAVRRAAELARLTPDLQEMKDGLDTLIGENGLMLSGGQKQRIAIARALLVDPEILILDDALSAVDARTESAILDNLRRVRAGRTTLIASHRMSAVSHADWIIVLDNGRIAEEGTHAMLMAAGGWYRRQYERQQLERSLEEGTA